MSLILLAKTSVKNNNTMTKKTTKKVKPAFIVDLTWAETSSDVMLAFANARFKAHIPLEERDYDIIVITATFEAQEVVNEIISSMIDAQTLMLNSICAACSMHEKPWYKRLWDWITKPFKKK